MTEQFPEGGERIAREYGAKVLGSLPLSLAIREQTDAGNPRVVAAPDSPETATYLAIADGILAGLGGEPQTIPEIVVSND